ncbi:unnamed protein product [Tenebrio molitor]|nr:unnamed protein product [Tenebrio molitor]
MLSSRLLIVNQQLCYSVLISKRHSEKILYLCVCPFELCFVIKDYYYLI